MFFQKKKRKKSYRLRKEQWFFFSDLNHRLLHILQQTDCMIFIIISCQPFIRLACFSFGQNGLYYCAPDPLFLLKNSHSEEFVSPWENSKFPATNREWICHLDLHRGTLQLGICHLFLTSAVPRILARQNPKYCVLLLVKCKCLGVIFLTAHINEASFEVISEVENP